MKPSLPQGTRDFSAEVVRKRQYIFNTIKKVYELYGFQPLETPALENLDTLMGKYGEEGDKLIFKILNNGLDNPAKKAKVEAGFSNILSGKMDKNITERALRYDLTIPFARYVAMHHGELTFPFRRYQIQPVWRADRPQHGRYREFYQCDADIVGSYALLNEAELVQIYATVFDSLKLPVEIHINNRKILAALAHACGGEDKLVDITTAIDKLDKIGLDKVKEELAERALQPEQIALIEKFLQVKGTNEEKNKAIQDLLGTQQAAQEGLKELDYILHHAGAALKKIVVDFSLARGLNYYTGTIFEVKALGAKMGSIGGGGRYDNLTGLFGVPDLPGVGISFGIDRIYDVLEELKLFPAEVAGGTQALFFNLGEKEGEAAFLLLQQVRSAGIAAEIYHEKAKFEKQFKYADKKQIPFAVIIGSEELIHKTAVVKDLRSGQQKEINQSELSSYLGQQNRN